MRVIVVAGARPNFMKCAPILKALARKKIKTFFVHTGQHYDYRMSRIFFKNLGLRRPDAFLNVGSAPRQKQIEKVRTRFEKVARRFHPDMVLVVGDVNSTLGAAIATKRIGVKLAHVEAGLRSFDDSMPEETNRIRTDALSDILFTTSESAGDNLEREGIPRDRIRFVGNVMIDTLVDRMRAAERSGILAGLGLRSGRYYVITLHRPSNVDDPKALKGILGSIEKMASGLKVVFPAHPRTEKMLKKFKLFEGLKGNPAFILTRPLGYLDFLKLVRHSQMVFTDSGGIQEETAYLKVPCVTLRANTERPVTVEAGNNIIAGNTPRTISRGFNKIKARFKRKDVKPIRFWDGRAAHRIAEVLCDEAKR